jgi:hypothetical protein
MLAEQAGSVLEKQGSLVLPCLREWGSSGDRSHDMTPTLCSSLINPPAFPSRNPACPPRDTYQPLSVGPRTRLLWVLVSCLHQDAVINRRLAITSCPIPAASPVTERYIAWNCCRWRYGRPFPA